MMAGMATDRLYNVTTCMMPTCHGEKFFGLD